MESCRDLNNCIYENIPDIDTCLDCPYCILFNKYTEEWEDAEKEIE